MQNKINDKKYNIHIQGGNDLAGNRILKFQSTGKLDYEELVNAGFLLGKIFSDSAGKNASPESLLALMKITYVSACWQIEKERGISRFTEEHDAAADALLHSWAEEKAANGDVRAKDFY